MKKTSNYSRGHGTKYESMEYNTMHLDEKNQLCKDVSYSKVNFLNILFSIFPLIPEYVSGEFHSGYSFSQVPLVKKALSRYQEQGAGQRPSELSQQAGQSLGIPETIGEIWGSRSDSLWWPAATV